MKSMRYLGTLPLACVAVLAGCTHIESLPDSRITPPGQALNGIPYALPMLQYKLDITRSLKRCPTSVTIEGEGDAKAITITDKNLVFQLKVEPTARYIPWERYTVDYRALSSFLKTTSYEIENYPSGVLKSVNVSADDHSGEVVRSVVIAGLAVATMASGNPIPAIAAVVGGTKGGGGTRGGGNVGKAKGDKDYERALQALEALAGRSNVIVCTPEAVAALAAINKNADSQETATRALAEATKEVERYTILANLKNARNGDVVGLGDGLKRQAARTLDVETLKEERTELDGAVSFSTTEYWPRTPQDTTIDLPLAAGEAAKFERMLVNRPVRTITPVDLQSWYQGLEERLREKVWKKYEGLLKPYVRKDGTAIAQRASVDSACTKDDPSVEACVAEALTITASLSKSSGTIPVCATGEKPATGCVENIAVDKDQKAGRFVFDDEPDPGVFIRPPGEGLFVVCRPEPGKTGLCPADRRLIWRDAVAAPQLGQLRFLPYSTKPFESAQLTLALREDGSVEKLEYSKTKAAGTELASTASDIATQIQTYLDKREEKKASGLTAARVEEIAGIQYQIDLLAKRAELLKAQTPISPDAQAGVKDETAQIETQTALLNAKLANLQTQVALTEAGGK